MLTMSTNLHLAMCMHVNQPLPGLMHVCITLRLANFSISGTYFHFILLDTPNNGIKLPHELLLTTS